MHLYGQYCPVTRAAEILADRWTLLIVRELLADVSHFNELERGLPRISRTLLSERLRRLEQAGVVERRLAPRGKRTEYRLTEPGASSSGSSTIWANGARAGPSASRGQTSSI
jgi:DNA-binding HxlR family transcriptional regulator